MYNLKNYLLFLLTFTYIFIELSKILYKITLINIFKTLKGHNKSTVDKLLIILTILKH